MHNSESMSATIFFKALPFYPFLLSLPKLQNDHIQLFSCFFRYLPPNFNISYLLGNPVIL